MMDYEEDDIIEYDDETKEVQRLFVERDEAYVNATQDIVNVIGPTVLEALYEVFEVPQDAVRWLDFQSTDNLLIVICSIKYNPSISIPEFIKRTREAIEHVENEVEQPVRIGIPYELVLSDPEEIVDFIYALVESHQTGGPTLIEHLEAETELSETTLHHVPVAIDAGEFNPAELTLEQKQQLLIFQHHTKDKLH